MTRASIDQSDDVLGFVWRDSTGTPVPLIHAMREPDSEPERLLPTHLEALDDTLIRGAGTLGEVLGGGRSPSSEERRTLVELYRAVDRAGHEYAEALDESELPSELRAGQIVGTAALMSYLARAALGLTAPPPLAADLADPAVGVVAGFGELVTVSPTEPWRGARWVIRTEQGTMLPAELSMLLFDSSGVNKEAAENEHREALEATTAAAAGSDADPMVAGAAIDWLLHDWLMAHRDDASSGAVEIASGRLDDALMIVRSFAASVRARATYDPGLLSLPRIS